MKPFCVTFMISVMILISGCSARQQVTNGIAKKIAGVLDAQYEKNLKNKPPKNVAAAQYCISTSASVATAIKTTDYLLSGYKTAVQGDTAGTDIAIRIGILQSALKNCAYVRCKEVSGVDVSAVRNLVNALGVNAGVEATADSCKKYQKLSGEIDKMISK